MERIAMFRTVFRARPLVRFNNLVLVVLCVLVGAALASNGFQVRRATAQGASAATQEQKALLSALENAFTSIAEQVEPAVVSIEARSTVRPAADDSRRQPNQDDQGGQGDPGDQDGPFSLPDLFRRFGTPQPRSGFATGSGLIVQRRGNDAYVLTNYHVVREQDKFFVTLNDKTKLPAKLVGRDPKTDLAVLKVTSERPLDDRQVARLGDSGRVKVGQWAIAIGSPLRYDATLTVGVVSAKGRDLDISATSRYKDLIQTDAAINPGNSGGPLVNIDGEVIGINVAIASPGGQGNIGIGFAIPVNQAKAILEELITTGVVKRGYLGVQTGTANRELSKELQELYGVKGGALVESLMPPDGPAAKAGMKPEDVIIRFDNKPINSFDDLESAVGSTPPGKTVPVTVVRSKREVTLNVTLALRDAEENLFRGPGGQQERPQRPNENQEVKTDLGLTVKPSSEAATAGVEISTVTPGSPAEDAGLRTGDIINRIGNDPVRDLASFRTLLGKRKPDSSVVFRVLTQTPNGRSPRIVVVRPQEP
jgi:serine protease Do